MDKAEDITLEYYNNRHLGDDWEPRGPTPGGPEEGQRMRMDMLNAMRGRRVLEITCGEGKSTTQVAEVAASVVAADAGEYQVGKARERCAALSNVQIVKADAYQLTDIQGDFDAGLATSWFPHVANQRYDEFFAGFHAHLEHGAIVFMTGCQMSERWRKRIVYQPGDSNAYCRRNLKDGSIYNVIDNFFTQEKLMRVFEHYGKNVQLQYGVYNWWVTYQV